jgi:hypothetical protein
MPNCNHCSHEWFCDKCNDAFYWLDHGEEGGVCEAFIECGTDVYEHWTEFGQ